jgi:acid phosphatase (class A)
MKNLLRLSFFLFLIAFNAEAAPYFPADKISPTSLDKPFVEGSSEMNDEIKKIIQLQQNANSAEVSKAERERIFTVETLVQTVDPQLTKAAFPKLYAMLQRVLETSDATAEVAKTYWKQRRPYLVDERVQILIKAHASFSYPSGHTTDSYVLAYVLSQIFPEKTGAFYVRSEEIAQHRVLVGMHFQRDLNGGRQLAGLLSGNLMQSADFLRDLEMAKKEVAHKQR